MDEQRIFVGRKAELEQFRQVLEDPRGQAVLVVGQTGMGKSWLLDRMAQLAQTHPDLRCGYVRYEITRTDTTDSTMALIIDHAFEAAQAKAGSFDKTDQRKRQWHALLKVILPKGNEIIELAQSLRRDPQKHTRDQFLDRLRLISKRMPENGRAVFAVDPEKYMEEHSADSWRLVVRELPEKVKFLFAQRPEDELVKSNTFMALPNVLRIPGEHLGVLADTEVEDLVRLRADRVGQSGKTLGDVASRYKGHPYAIQAALDIVKKTGRIEGLPSDPTPEKIAESQWQQVCQDSEAIRLFEAYAILEVGVPADVVVAVSDLDGTSCKRLHSDTYLRGLLRDDGHGQRIYHAILADHILGEMREDEKSQYHRRAADFYRTRLKQAKDQQTAPDVLAAARLAEHVLSPEGNEAFVTTFTDECGQALINLGLFDEFIGLSQRALKAVETGSAKEAMLLGNLGLVYQKRSDLDEAEKMFEKALDIEKKLGRLEGVANNYGNLGVIHRIRGDLDRAQVMHTKALEIDQKLERHHSVGAHYGNLGLIHKMRGDLDQAEKTLKKALEILGQIGNLQGVADVSGNLGLLYQDRGDLDRADQMHKKSLEINEKLGRLEGMANQYGNLGLVCQGRGDLDGAEAMHEKSIQINEKLGRLEGTASQYGNLGLVYRKRGDLDAAEEMHKKSLEIAERLGRPEVMALQYGNLGNVYFTRGDLDRADKMYRRALEIDERLGMLGGMAGEYTNLGLICLTRGDTGKAREYWAKAVELYKKTGMPHMVAKVQGLLDGLPQEQE